MSKKFFFAFLLALPALLTACPDKDSGEDTAGAAE